MATYTISIAGDKRLSDALKKTAAKARDLRPFFERIYTESFLPEMGETFETQPWKPLSPPYLQWKTQAGYPREIGQLTRAMIKSLTGTSRSRGTVKRISKLKATFGTSLDYASSFDRERPLMVHALPKIASYIDENISTYILELLNYKGTK